jgi:PTH1 family peptidyl-tRNA hydrolase
MNKATPTKIKAIIGLGNPLKEYKDTYHNIGRIFVEFLLSKEISFNFLSTSKKSFKYCKLSKKILIIPETFMNESGIAVKEAISYFKIKPQEILVVHDDSDISIGNFKITFNQSSAGHKGIQSIIDNLKTQEFWRLKIGIRPQSEKVRKKAQEIVLKKISNKDKQILQSVFKDAALKIEEIL